MSLMAWFRAIEARYVELTFLLDALKTSRFEEATRFNTPGPEVLNLVASMRFIVSGSPGDDQSHNYQRVRRQADRARFVLGVQECGVVSAKSQLLI
jgi:hypothetical protein